MANENETPASTESQPKVRKESMRSVLMAAIRGGQNDVEKLVAIGKAKFPEWEEKRIRASIIVHKGVIKKESEKAAATPVAA